MFSRFRLLYAVSVLALLGLVVSSVPAQAASSNISGAVTQSYNAGPAVLPGMIVELAPKDPTTVIALSTKDIRSMLGVVVPVNDAPIVLTPPSVASQQVLVATSGRYDLLVSNQNGPIKSGDYLTISALSGIGMETGTNQTQIIGRAAGNFNGSDNIIGTVSLKDSSGHTTKVALSHLMVDVRLGPNPLYAKNASNLPGFLIRTANGLSNEPVTPVRVYLSAAVLLATLITAISMFYTGVHTSIVAIGRNPLAKKSINRTMLQTILAALIIFVIGLAAVYLILNP